MLKLVAMDLDGTLLDSKKNITKENIKAIKKIKKQGIITIICTGRTLFEVKHIEQFKEVQPYIDYIIYENGAAAVDKNDSILFSYPMKQEDIENVHNILKDFDMMFEVYHKGKAYCNNILMQNENYKKYIMEEFYKLVEDTRQPVDDIIDFSKGVDINMILVSFISREKSVEAYELIKDLPNYITFAGVQGLEIHSENVNKGNGIKKISDMIGINKYEIFAIGDSYNDLPMKHIANTLVAMDNASSKLKDISDFVTDTNDNSGVAKALEKYVLKTF